MRNSANIIPADYPDCDVIRVGDIYYMVSTTMHYMPGCVILRSYNLLNWEIACYVSGNLDSTAAQKLEDNRGVYGQGMWAACIRFHNDRFYVSFVANDTHKSYLYVSEPANGRDIAELKWEKSNMTGFYHDMSVLFDDDGKVYVVSGNMEIHLTEMKPDLSAPAENGKNKVIIRDDPEKSGLGYEGSHIYKINGRYYIFLIHIPKGKMRTEACYVSDKIDGPYSGGEVYCEDFEGWNSGIAQGGIVQANDGKWYGILFQDHGALGRIPILVPVTFENGFPVFHKIPEGFTIPDNRPGYKYKPLYSSDFCNTQGELDFNWQWNHVPAEKLITLRKKEYTIRTNKLCVNLTQAENTLTQRTYTEHCSGSVLLDGSDMQEGDFAGLGALEGQYAFIGLTKKNGQLKLITAGHKLSHSQWAMHVYDTEEPEIMMEREISGTEVELKLNFELVKEGQKVQLCAKNQESGSFEVISEFPLVYSLDQFVGVRFALFCYSTKISGGKAVFKNFEYLL